MANEQKNLRPLFVFLAVYFVIVVMTVAVLVWVVAAR